MDFIYGIIAVICCFVIGYFGIRHIAALAVWCIGSAITFWLAFSSGEIFYATWTFVVFLVVSAISSLAAWVLGKSVGK